jgi:hypothetical protein
LCSGNKRIAGNRYRYKRLVYIPVLRIGNRGDLLMKKKSKTQRKKARREWWKSLTPEQKSEYLGKVVKKKSFKWREEHLRIMKKYGDKFKCSECFHRGNGSCTDDMPQGCPYWYSPQAKEQGPALMPW